MNPIEIILFILPAYIANATPVIFSGWGPLDRGANFLDKKRLFGDSKTVRGSLGGILAGFLVGAFLSYFVTSDYLTPPLAGGPAFGLQEKLLISFLMAFGTIVGDLLGSFFKRRLDIGPGEPLFVTDQLLFILTAIAFSTIPRGFFIHVYDLLVILVVTLFMHLLANAIAHRLNLKKVPW